MGLSRSKLVRTVELVEVLGAASAAQPALGGLAGLPRLLGGLVDGSPAGASLLGLRSAEVRASGQAPIPDPEDARSRGCVCHSRLLLSSWAGGPAPALPVNQLHTLHDGAGQARRGASWLHWRRAALQDPVTGRPADQNQARLGASLLCLRAEAAQAGQRGGGLLGGLLGLLGALLGAAAQAAQAGQAGQGGARALGLRRALLDRLFSLLGAAAKAGQLEALGRLLGLLAGLLRGALGVPWPASCRTGPARAAACAPALLGGAPVVVQAAVCGLVNAGCRDGCDLILKLWLPWLAKRGRVVAMPPQAEPLAVKVGAAPSREAQGQARCEAARRSRA